MWEWIVIILLIIIAFYYKGKSDQLKKDYIRAIQREEFLFIAYTSIGYGIENQDEQEINKIYDDALYIMPAIAARKGTPVEFIPAIEDMFPHLREYVKSGDFRTTIAFAQAERDMVRLAIRR